MKKRINTIVLTLIMISNTSIKSFALEEDLVSKLDELDYNQRKEAISNILLENEAYLYELTELLEENEESLIQNENEILNIKRTNDTNKRNSGNLINNNELKIIELLLTSENISDFLKNLNLTKIMYINQNKQINSLLLKEEELLEERNDLISEKEDILKVISSKENKQNELIKIKEEILELMDKRGELLFNPSNLLEVSNVSVESMYKALEGTALYELAPVYVEAENLYGVNAIFIASLTAQESGWGTSRRAIEDNNLTGFGVYTDNSIGINSNSKRGNILATTKWIKEKYLTPGASYFNGYGIKDVNVRYSVIGSNPNYEWSSNITQIGNKLINDIK